MSRVSMFSAPFLLGFEALEERMDRMAKAADGYPPYNIERTFDADGTERFLISIAVAGFRESELEVVAEHNQLVVRGRQKEETPREFLHRGIAADAAGTIARKAGGADPGSKLTLPPRTVTSPRSLGHRPGWSARSCRRSDGKRKARA